MFNKHDAKALLDGFEPIPMGAWDHFNSVMDLNVSEGLPESGFCVGHLAGFILTDAREDTCGPCRKGIHYRSGVTALERLFGLDQDELVDTLHLHGAPSEPFGEVVWGIDPYDVFLDICKKKYGYDYKAELLEAMLPDDIFNGQDIPETVVIDGELEPALA